MGYRLFLDDERYPPDDGGEWTVVRSVAEAQETVVRLGFPDYVSFDNDLGDRLPEGRDFARWLIEIELDLDSGGMPDNFGWCCHTQNPVARDAIDGLLVRYVEHKRQGRTPML